MLSSRWLLDMKKKKVRNSRHKPTYKLINEAFEFVDLHRHAKSKGPCAKLKMAIRFEGKKLGNSRY